MTHGHRRSGVWLAVTWLVAGCAPGPNGDPVPPGAGGRNAPPPATPAADAAEAGATAGETAPAPTPDAEPGDRAMPPAPPDPPAPPAPPPPDAPAATGLERYLPRPTGPCPELAAGMVSLRAGGITRQARVWIGPAAAQKDGPLVFYWYGTNGNPAQAEQALGADTIAAITAAGGLVIAPVHDPAAGTWPWHLVAGRSDRDLLLADELVACALATPGIDRRRIHAVGFSAGAIHTVQMSYLRSGYLASVVTFSGAQGGDIPDQDPGNKLAAMIFHGGANDRVVIPF